MEWKHYAAVDAMQMQLEGRGKKKRHASSMLAAQQMKRQSFPFLARFQHCTLLVASFTSIHGKVVMATWVNWTQKFLGPPAFS
jgi:hypothetical protein